jgi:hypothetical protein
MTLSTTHSAAPGATAEIKREELGSGVSSSTAASSIESLHMSRPKTQKQKDAKRFRRAMRKLWEHIRHGIPRITINITMNFPEVK